MASREEPPEASALRQILAEPPGDERTASGSGGHTRSVQEPRSLVERRLPEERAPGVVPADEEIESLVHDRASRSDHPGGAGRVDRDVRRFGCTRVGRVPTAGP